MCTLLRLPIDTCVGVTLFWSFKRPRRKAINWPSVICVAMSVSIPPK